MRILIVALCVMLMPLWAAGDGVPTVAQSQWSRERVVEEIKREARMAGISPALALSIAEIESSLNPKVSSRYERHLRTYSVGLFQVLHATARLQFGFQGSINELKNPAVNIPMGVKYLSMCLPQTLRHIACCYQAGFAAEQSFCDRHEGVQSYLRKLREGVARWADTDNEDAT